METKQKVISVNSVQFSDVFICNSAKSHTEPFPTDVLLAETFAWRFPLSANTRMSTGRKSDHIQVVQVSFIRLLGCCCSFMQYFFDMCLDITTIHAFHLFQFIYFDTWYYFNIIFNLLSNICYHVVSVFYSESCFYHFYQLHLYWKKHKPSNKQGQIITFVKQNNDWPRSARIMKLPENLEPGHFNFGRF